MALNPEELSSDQKLYDMIDKVVIVKGAIPSDPTVWEFHIQGKILKVDTEDLENMSPFRKQFLKAFDRPSPKIKASRWSEVLEALAEDKAECVQAVEESGPVFIAREIFEIICSRDMSDEAEDAVSGLTLFKYEENEGSSTQTYCCMPSQVVQNIVTDSGFKIPLNDLSGKMVELKMKRPGTKAIRYGKGRKLRTWWFLLDAVKEQQKEG